MIRIGASGFSYDDWVGPVYPTGLPPREHLGFYAAEFSTVEINTTYYRIPAAGLVRGWIAKTPESFTFSVKAYQGLTHEREQPDFAGFVAAIRPLARPASWRASSPSSPTHFTRRLKTATISSACATAWAICRE